MNQSNLFSKRIATLKQYGEGSNKASFAIVGSFPELTPTRGNVLLFATDHELANTMMNELKALKAELPSEQQTEVSLSIETIWVATKNTDKLTDVKLESKWFNQFSNLLRSIQEMPLVESSSEQFGNIKTAKKFKNYWVEQGLPFHFCAAYYALRDELMTEDEKSDPELTTEDWAAYMAKINLHRLIRFRQIS